MENEKMTLENIKTQKNEQSKLYNENGQVENSKIAEEMAYAEKPFKEGTLKGFKKWFSNEKTGEKLAEKVGELLHNLGSPELIRDEERSPYGTDIYETKFNVENDKFAIRFMVWNIQGQKPHIHKIMVTINDERFSNPESAVDPSDEQIALQKIFKPLIDCKKIEVKDLIDKEYKEMKHYEKIEKDKKAFQD